MYNRLFSCLTHAKQLFSTQFGFRQGHSTSHAVSLLIQKITTAFEKKNNKLWEYLLIYVKHLILLINSILLQKLQHFGVQGVALNWFTNNLKARTQQVSYMGVSSYSSNGITTSVPKSPFLDYCCLFCT